MNVSYTSVLDKLFKFENLSLKELSFVFGRMMNGEMSSTQITALLVALRMKGETSQELISIVKVLKSKMVEVSFDSEIPYLIDTCGTGGDQANYFNISTASALVCAASGAFVAKHGNKGISSSCGSANVLEALGISLDIPIDKMKKSIEVCKIGFLYAVNHHPAMQSVAKVRQELEQKTIFNLLGPLINPARVKRQIIGVFDKDLLPLYADVICHLEMEKVIILHGHGGVDEISLTGPTQYVEITNGEQTKKTFDPVQYGFKLCSSEDLQGGTVIKNVEIIRDIIQGKKGFKQDIVVLNAGFGLYVSGLVETLEEGFELALQSIEFGKVQDKLDSWISFLKN